MSADSWPERSLLTHAPPHVPQLGGSIAGPGDEGPVVAGRGRTSRPGVSSASRITFCCPVSTSHMAHVSYLRWSQRSDCRPGTGGNRTGNPMSRQLPETRTFPSRVFRGVDGAHVGVQTRMATVRAEGDALSRHDPGRPQRDSVYLVEWYSIATRQ